MALILCPECNKQISDKASFCPHCGYPINDLSNNLNSDSSDLNTITLFGSSYDITEAVQLINNNEKIKAVKVLRETIPNLSLSDAKDIADCIANKGIVSNNNIIQNSPKIDKNVSHIKIIKCKACSKEISNQAEICPHCGQPTGVHICPKCKSTDTKVISGASKAASVALFGIFAANKVKSNFQCNKCGHKF